MGLLLPAHGDMQDVAAKAEGIMWSENSLWRWSGGHVPGFLWRSGRSIGSVWGHAGAAGTCSAGKDAGYADASSTPKRY